MLSYWNNSDICSITFILVVDAQIVKEVLQELKDNQLITDYAEYEKKITIFLQKAAKTEDKLITELSKGMIDNKTMQEVEKEMSTVINQERVDFIKKSLLQSKHTK